MFDLFLPLVGEVPKGMGAGGGRGCVKKLRIKNAELRIIR
jgi:hypothetical protein